MRLLSASGMIVLAAFAYFVLSAVTKENVSWKVSTFCVVTRTTLGVTGNAAIPVGALNNLDCDCLTVELIKPFGARWLAGIVDGLRRVVLTKIANNVTFHGSDPTDPDEYGVSKEEMQTFGRTIAHAGLVCQNPT
jgi:hypothetical protein